jgi:hypothetical protein
MVNSNIPFAGSYLELLPINTIAKYPEGPPKNGIPFAGYPQQHPAEKDKLILVYDPLGENPAVLEFKIDDILYVEEISQAVTEKGEGVPLAKLWIRRGAHGMFLEPFEVNESVNFLELRLELQKRFVNRQSGKTGGFSPAGPIRL